MLACAQAVEALAPRCDQRVLILGHSRAARRARLLGLRGEDRIAPPLGDPSLAGTAFKRLLLAHGPFDIVHAWGVPMTRLVRQLSGGPRLFVTDLLTGHVHRCFGGTLGPIVATLAPAGLSPPLAEAWRARRAPLRSRLALDDDHPTLALLADPPHASNAARFATVLLLLEKCGLSVLGVLDASTAHLDRVGETPLSRALSLGLRTPGIPIPMALAACDAAVLAPPPRHDEPLPQSTWAERSMARVSMQLGVPVVTSQVDAIPTLLHPACGTSRWHPVGYGAVLTALLKDPAAHRRASRAALEWASTPDDNPNALARVWELAPASTQPAPRAPEAAAP